MRFLIAVSIICWGSCVQPASRFYDLAAQADHGWITYIWRSGDRHTPYMGASEAVLTPQPHRYNSLDCLFIFRVNVVILS